MHTLFLEPFSGISGDMFLGALLDLGADAEALQRELAKLGVGGWHLHAERRTRSGLSGIWANVHLDHGHDHGHSHADGHSHPDAQEHEPVPGHSHAGAHGHSHAHAHAHEHEHHLGHEEHRDFADIRTLINDSPLSLWVKERAIAVFTRLAAAEGQIHGLPPDEVHFHEVGAVDSIVDIVGGCIALDLLGRPRVVSTPAVEGSGTVHCAHGLLPVPAPATLEILRARGIPFTQCDEPHELVTPTGAALLAEFAEEFGPLHDVVVQRVGYGLGTRDNRTRPNVLRASLCLPATAQTSAHDWQTDTIVVLETNLDDLSGEVLGQLVPKALAAGALDVFHTPIQMKKNRPGVLLTVLCTPPNADRFTELLLRETSSFGVRRTFAERRKLHREFTVVNTAFGDVSVKLGLLDGRVVQAAPEFEPCRLLAELAGVPVRVVIEAALRALPAGAGIG
jgi:uncharacterized protein (TIGR00299 family) protein